MIKVQCSEFLSNFFRGLVVMAIRLSDLFVSSRHVGDGRVGDGCSFGEAKDRCDVDVDGYWNCKFWSALAKLPVGAVVMAGSNGNVDESLRVGVENAGCVHCSANDAAWCSSLYYVVLHCSYLYDRIKNDAKVYCG